MNQDQRLKIYLDNCCFNRPYDDQSQLKIELETKAKLYIQKLIVDEKVEFVSSYILEYENNDNPYEVRKTAIEDFFRYAAQYIDESSNLLLLAENIAKTGLKAKDALHVASAIIAECDYFISTDIRLLKYHSSQIKLLNPIDFIREMEEIQSE